MDSDIIRIIVHEVFEAYDSDNHYDDYENLRHKLEAAGVSDAWERDIDSDLKAARDTIETSLALLDEIERLQQKVQRANALAVAAEQVLKAWSMGDYLTPFMDDLRNALLDFEGPVASEDG